MPEGEELLSEAQKAQLNVEKVTASSFRLESSGTTKDERSTSETSLNFMSNNLTNNNFLLAQILVPTN